LEQAGLRAGISGRELNQVFFTMLGQSEKVVNMMNELGLTISYLPDGTINFSDALKKLSDYASISGNRLKLAAAISHNFSVVGSRALETLINSFSEYSKVLKETQTDTDSLDKMYQKVSESMSVQLNRIKQAFLTAFAEPKFMEKMKEFVDTLVKKISPDFILSIANTIFKLANSFINFITTLDFEKLGRTIENLASILSRFASILSTILNILTSIPDWVLKFLVTLKLLNYMFPILNTYLKQTITYLYEYIAAAVSARVASYALATAISATGVGALLVVGGLLASYLAFGGAQTEPGQFREVLRTGPVVVHKGEVVSRTKEGKDYFMGGGSTYNINNLNSWAKNYKEFEDGLRRMGLR